MVGSLNAPLSFAASVTDQPRCFCSRVVETLRRNHRDIRGRARAVGSGVKPAGAGPTQCKRDVARCGRIVAVGVLHLDRVGGRTIAAITDAFRSTSPSRRVADYRQVVGSANSRLPWRYRERFRRHCFCVEIANMAAASDAVIVEPVQVESANS